MNHEDKLIAMINGMMPKSPLRKSKSGEVDAEVVLLDGKEYLFSTDDFSAEDLFIESDPFGLGWNIACGALSDIVAAGGKPLVYAHSMVVPKAWNEEYVRQFSLGVSAVLKTYSVSFIGGDLGISDSWRYTASVIGVPFGRIVNRKGCEAGDAILLTGKVGAGNLAAISRLFADNESICGLLEGQAVKFPTHEKLSPIIAKYASSAIDTSDGVFAALHTLAKLNKAGFHLCEPNYDLKALQAVRLLQLPKLLLLLGECGEYEILFTVSQKHREALQAELKQLDIEAHELGEITSKPDQQSVASENITYNLADYTIRARDYDNSRDYLQAMITWVKKASQ
jgi:thiamine-monophosphate kinase